MSFLKDDPVTQLSFALHENKGVFAVLLGSGLSRAAEIPTGWEITLDLIRRIATAKGVEEQADWERWYREETGREPNYSTLLEEISESPSERRAILHRYIEPDESDRAEGRKLPTKAHQAIADLVSSGHVKVILTTNFDRLMESALREHGIEPTVISSEDALAGAEPIAHSRCYVLKLHGDYKDARILNTDRELSAYPDRYDRVLDRIFDEYGLIICGWSGEWDHALRSAILRSPNRRYSVYWAARGDLGERAAELASHRAARVVKISAADDFFQMLSQRVDVLEQSQHQNPSSVELLVNSAKRFLAKPEYRIQLDELFEYEASRIVDSLGGAQFSTQGQWSTNRFRATVKAYEAIAEPIVRMSGVLGRWGDGRDFEIVADVLRNMWQLRKKTSGGLTYLLYLRAYPAVLIFTAYGIGLTKAERWGLLLKLFLLKLDSDPGGPESAVRTLFLSAWDGGKNDFWKELDGYERRKTALSDHLLEVMIDWRKSFAGAEVDFELLFERFEFMASLVAFQQNDLAEMRKSAESRQGSSDAFVWMPAGRSIWHNSVFRVLEDELSDQSMAGRILEIGFANGSQEYLSLFIENFRRFAERAQWS